MAKFPINSSSLGGLNNGLKIKEAEENGSELNKTTGRTYARYENIKPNELNKDFKQEDAEKIKLSILEKGLFHELTVVKSGNGYRLISGEQRYRAIGLMTEEERNRVFPKGIPVNVLPNMKSEKEERITIIEANILSRDYTPEERTRYTLELLDFYKEKKDKGEISNLRQELANALNIQERQAQRIISAGKVNEDLRQALISGQIDMKEAEKFSAFSEETQETIAEMLKNSNGKGIDKEKLESLKAFETKNKELEKQINSSKKEIAQKDELITELQEMLEVIGKETKEEKDDFTYLNQKLEEEMEARKAAEEALSNSEKERKRAQTNLEALRMSYKEKEERGLQASEQDIKRAKELAKAETTFNAMFANMKEVKKLKVVINSDEELKDKYKNIASEIIKDLQELFINS